MVSRLMKKLLIAQGLEPFMMKAMAFLQRAEISVLTAATNDELLKLHIETNAQLLITSLEMPGMACETLIQTIRRGEHFRTVPILVLCDDSPVQRMRGSTCGADAVLPLNADPARLAGKVQELINVALRRHYRVVLNIAVEGKHNSRTFLCTSENISSSGLLIRTTENLLQDDPITCSFYLPDGKHISASGEIVRAIKHISSTEVNRYGIRFVSPAPDPESALASFVEKEVRRLSAGSTGSLRASLIV